MSDGSIRTLFVDTSSLRRAGFQSPDLRKLLVLSREKSLRVVVSHIAWEEWRTQLLEKSCDKVRGVRTAFDALKTVLPSNFILGRLPAPALAVWEDPDIEAASKEAMAEFAAEYRIEILPIGSDHGERTWRKYFNVKIEPPFNPSVKDREKRRKDIPDSWIYEAAVDLVTQDRQLAALCYDENLGNALASLGVKVFCEPADLVAELERRPALAAEAEAATPVEPAAAPNDAPLSVALSQALDAFRDHERKVLGFIAHFGSPSKEELFGLLARSGLSREIAENVADRLVYVGVVRDTGNHYLVTDKQLARLAIPSVEEEIIKLLSAEPSNGL